jgi:hypothetical protein
MQTSMCYFWLDGGLMGPTKSNPFFRWLHQYLCLQWNFVGLKLTNSTQGMQLNHRLKLKMIHHNPILGYNENNKSPKHDKKYAFMRI